MATPGIQFTAADVSQLGQTVDTVQQLIPTVVSIGRNLGDLATRIQGDLTNLVVKGEMDAVLNKVEAVVKDIATMEQQQRVAIDQLNQGKADGDTVNKVMMAADDRMKKIEAEKAMLETDVKIMQGDLKTVIARMATMGAGE